MDGFRDVETAAAQIKKRRGRGRGEEGKSRQITRSAQNMKEPASFFASDLEKIKMRVQECFVLSLYVRMCSSVNNYT